MAKGCSATKIKINGVGKNIVQVQDSEGNLFSIPIPVTRDIINKDQDGILFSFDVVETRAKVLHAVGIVKN